MYIIICILLTFYHAAYAGDNNIIKYGIKSTSSVMLDDRRFCKS